MDYNKLLYLAEKNKQDNIKNAQKKLYSTELTAPKRDPKPQINLDSPLIKKFIAQRSSNAKSCLPSSGAPVLSTKKPSARATEPSSKPKKVIPSVDKNEVAGTKSPIKIKKCKIAPPPLSYEEILKLAERKQKEDRLGPGVKNNNCPDDHSSKSLEKQLAEWRYRMHPPKKKLRTATPKETPSAPLPKKPQNAASAGVKDVKRPTEKSDFPAKNLDKSSGPTTKTAKLQPAPVLSNRLVPVKPNHPATKASLSSHPKSSKLKADVVVGASTKIPSNHHILYCHKTTDQIKPLATNANFKMATSKPKIPSVSSTTLRAPKLVETDFKKNGYTSSGFNKTNGTLQRTIPRHLLPTNGRMSKTVKSSRYAGEISESELEQEEEEEEDYESEVDSFVDDDDGQDKEYSRDYSKHIKEIFGYDKTRYANERDDDIVETSFREQMKEEARSARIGKLEDLEDIRMEKEMLMRKMQKKPGLSRKF